MWFHFVYQTNSFITVAIILRKHLWCMKIARISSFHERLHIAENQDCLFVFKKDWITSTSSLSLIELSSVVTEQAKADVTFFIYIEAPWQKKLYTYLWVWVLNKNHLVRYTFHNGPKLTTMIKTNALPFVCFLALPFTALIRLQHL